MGQMRFLTPRRDRLPAKAAQRAYVAGPEGIPWQSFNRWENQQLVVERAVSESGSLYIPWLVDGHGELVLSTGSLMERGEPYHLPVELARGTVNRLRSQAFDWEMAGLVMDAALRSRLRDVTQHFAQAATTQHDALAAADEADLTLRLCLDAMGQLCAQYSSQALAARHQREARFPTIFAGHLGNDETTQQTAQSLLQAFNSAVVPLSWRHIQTGDNQYDWTIPDQQVQWCRENKLTILGGPLLQLDASNLPDWMYLWEDDFETLQSYLWQFIEQAVGRYHSQVQVWHLAARMNLPGALALSEEQQLRLVVGGIEVLRGVDQRTPIFISFDQPWGEYLARQQLDLSPLHFADALVRGSVGLSGIGLEINWGYWPGGTQTRDLLELNRQIDRWAGLGLPLLVLLTVPSSSGEDPRARPGIGALTGQSPEANSDGQKAAVERLIPLLLAKSAVHGVIWNQFCDARPHEFPHGGLLDAQARPKPALEVIMGLRQQHLV